MDVTHVTRALFIGPERFVAFVTGKRVLPSMNRHMYFQMGTMLESVNNQNVHNLRMK